MGNIVEKKAFWVILIISFVLLIGGLIFALVMTIKYGEPGEPKEEEKVGFGVVRENNAFLDFCNDENLYALDANLASNPITRITVVTDSGSNAITDANQINDIWNTIKAMKIADASSEGVTPAHYTLIFSRNNGSDQLITFQSPTLLTVNNKNYNISDSAGLFGKI